MYNTVLRPTKPNTFTLFITRHHKPSTFHSITCPYGAVRVNELENQYRNGENDNDISTRHSNKARRNPWRVQLGLILAHLLPRTVRLTTAKNRDPGGSRS